MVDVITPMDQDERMVEEVYVGALKSCHTGDRQYGREHFNTKRCFIYIYLFIDFIY